MKIELDHIGFITKEKKDKEKYAAGMKLWLTDPKDNPFNIEWLRFEDDSPVIGPVREKNHIAYRVDDLDEASKGLKVLIEPFKAENFLKIGFYEYNDETVLELMQFLF
ncbi:MAG: VOC family protein [Candidatus Humimicrobiaceae bacterium]